MPLFYQHNINQNTKLAIWKIEEEENYFLEKVPLQRNITHPHKRLQHLAARHLLRFLFDDFPYDEILIADTRKPFLQNEQYHFSISHCGDFAAAIVSKNERVGIDIEQQSEKILNIVPKFLNENELLLLQQSAVSSQRSERNNINIDQSSTIDQQPTINYQRTTNHQLSTILWCTKETVFKWWSFGKVDFRENILVKKINENDDGMVQVNFIKDNVNIALEVTYKMFDDLCLTFVNTNL